VQDLIDIIKQRSYRRGKFKLASGAESEFYFNLKPTMMNPKGAYLCARALLHQIRSEKVDYVGGLEMGAVPVIANIRPSGDTYLMEDFYYAGGLPAMLERLNAQLQEKIAEQQQTAALLEASEARVKAANGHVVTAALVPNGFH